MMKMKKLVVGAMALGIMGMGAIGLGATQAGAETLPIEDAPGWQDIGTESITPSKTLVKTGAIFLSGGGNVGIKIPKHTVSSFDGEYPVLEVELWSDNGAGTEVDEEIATAYFYPNMMTGSVTKTIDVDEYVDGTNLAADVYAVYKTNYVSPTITATIRD